MFNFFGYNALTLPLVNDHRTEHGVRDMALLLIEKSTCPGISDMDVLAVPLTVLSGQLRHCTLNRVYFKDGEGHLSVHAKLTNSPDWFDIEALLRAGVRFNGFLSFHWHGEWCDEKVEIKGWLLPAEEVWEAAAVINGLIQDFNSGHEEIGRAHV